VCRRGNQDIDSFASQDFGGCPICIRATGHAFHRATAGDERKIEVYAARSSETVCDSGRGPAENSRSRMRAAIPRGGPEHLSVPEQDGLRSGVIEYFPRAGFYPRATKSLLDRK